MCVVDVLAWGEAAGFDVQTHFLVGIAERHALTGKAVHFLHRENRVVYLVVQYMLVHLHLVDDVGRHDEAVLQLVECRQEGLFDDLQVAEIAARQVVHNQRDGLRQCLQLVAFGTGQFKHVWVFLVRHDARAGGAVVGQFHETEVLAVEHAGVERHLGDGAGQRCHGERHVALCLASAHLGIHHVVVH